VIAEIAFQANILALSAALESARDHPKIAPQEKKNKKG
jgi:hypothetical protein